MAEWLYGLADYANDLRVHWMCKALLGFCFAVLSVLYGLPHVPSEALLQLMVFDFVLGALHAFKADNGLDPAKFFRGLCKFMIYGVAVRIAILLDDGTGASFLGLSWRGAICGYLCAHEALSALTHLEVFGFPFPKGIKSRLRQYRDNLGRMRGTKKESEPDAR